MTSVKGAKRDYSEQHHRSPETKVRLGIAQRGQKYGPFF